MPKAAPPTTKRRRGAPKKRLWRIIQLQMIFEENTYYEEFTRFGIRIA
jgi:hypothetical protein